MIGYVTRGTNDIERAREFYDALFGSVGIGRIMEFGENFTVYGSSMNAPGLAITLPYDGQQATPGNGTMVALPMDSRDKVDAFHAKALELGGSDEGAPGLRGDVGPQAFYAAYFRDPDGNKYCTYRMGPAD